MNCSENSDDFYFLQKNLPYPGDTVYYKTLDAVDYVKIIFIVLVIIGSALGNISVVIVVAVNKSMHNTINTYVANLAVADSLISTLCMIPFLHKYIAAKNIYLLGPLMCNISSFSQVTVLTSSVLTLSAIACDRFTAILFPLRNRITKHRRGIVITAIWIISVAVGFPLLLVKRQFYSHFTDFIQPVCSEEWPQVYSEKESKCVQLLWLRTFYYTFVSVSLFFIPAIIMTVAYSLILWKVSVSDIPGERSETNSSLQNESRRKVLKMVITVLVVFMICWIPLQIILLYESYKTSYLLPYWFSDVANLAEFLAFFNSFCNPIIYGVFNKSFRDSLCLVLQCKMPVRRFSSTTQAFQKFRATFTTSLTSSSGQRKRSAANPEEVVIKQEKDEGADFAA